MIAPEVAGKLLDEVIYEQVLGMVDLEGLFAFERELWCALAECGVAETKVTSLAREMIDRALQRIPEDPRRYITFGKPGEDCELCEQLERDAHAKRLLRSS